MCQAGADPWCVRQVLTGLKGWGGQKCSGLYFIRDKAAMDSWMKLKEDEKRGERDFRNALKELEDSKKGTLEAVKKDDTLHKLWVEAERGRGKDCGLSIGRSCRRG